METATNYTAFDGYDLIFRGPLTEVVTKIKKRMGRSENSSVLIFSDETGQTIDFNFHGSENDIVKRLETFVSSGRPKEASGPGRPKLGVVAREVSLLPRHWEWLATQQGGASASLRRLVDDAKKKYEGGSTLKQAQERTYKFMSIVAGDMKGYEEALRALYKKDEEKFLTQISGWPNDVKRHVTGLAKSVFQK